MKRSVTLPLSAGTLASSVDSKNASASECPKKVGSFWGFLRVWKKFCGVLKSFEGFCWVSEGFVEYSEVLGNLGGFGGFLGGFGGVFGGFLGGFWGIFGEVLKSCVEFLKILKKWLLTFELF